MYLTQPVLTKFGMKHRKPVQDSITSLRSACERFASSNITERLFAIGEPFSLNKCTCNVNRHSKVQSRSIRCWSFNFAPHKSCCPTRSQQSTMLCQPTKDDRAGCWLLPMITQQSGTFNQILTLNADNDPYNDHKDSPTLCRLQWIPALGYKSYPALIHTTIRQRRQQAPAGEAFFATKPAFVRFPRPDRSSLGP